MAELADISASAFCDGVFIGVPQFVVSLFISPRRLCCIIVAQYCIIVVFVHVFCVLFFFFFSGRARRPPPDLSTSGCGSALREERARFVFFGWRF